MFSDPPLLFLPPVVTFPLVGAFGMSPLFPRFDIFRPTSSSPLFSHSSSTSPSFNRTSFGSRFLSWWISSFLVWDAQGLISWVGPRERLCFPFRIFPKSMPAEVELVVSFFFLESPVPLCSHFRFCPSFFYRF